LYRREVLGTAVKRRTEEWRQAKRVAPDLRLSDVNALFVVHYLLSRVTPAGAHRWLTDPLRRREAAARMYLFCVSPQFQSAYGRHIIGEMINRWKRQGRIDLAEARLLRRQLADNDLDEYVRCLGMHLGLKLFLPLVMPLKVGGVAAALATANPLYLLPVFIMPALRTAITVWRMVHPSRRRIRYFEALAIGALPTVGSLAYPVQMRASHPELSALLLRDAASRLAQWMPIYGGKDSRLEIWAIKGVNLVLEAMDLLRAAARPLERLLSRGRAERPRDVAPATVPFRRWAKLEAEEIERLAGQESADVSEVETAWNEWMERRAKTRAA
jgi:hypothetical protein